MKVYEDRPVYDWTNSDHIVIRDRQFMGPPNLDGNVEDGTADHAVWLQLISSRAPVLLIKPAYDAIGRIMDGYSAVFIPVELQEEIEEEFGQVKANGDWSHYKRPTPYLKRRDPP